MAITIVLALSSLMDHNAGILIPTPMFVNCRLCVYRNIYVPEYDSYLEFMQNGLNDSSNLLEFRQDLVSAASREHTETVMIFFMSIYDNVLLIATTTRTYDDFISTYHKDIKRFFRQELYGN